MCWTICDLSLQLTIQQLWMNSGWVHVWALFLGLVYYLGQMDLHSLCSWIWKATYHVVVAYVFTFWEVISYSPSGSSYWWFVADSDQFYKLIMRKNYLWFPAPICLAIIFGLACWGVGWLGTSSWGCPSLDNCVCCKRWLAGFGDVLRETMLYLLSCTLYTLGWIAWRVFESESLGVPMILYEIFLFVLTSLCS